jgi:hypothetical protein
MDEKVEMMGMIRGDEMCEQMNFEKIRVQLCVSFYVEQILSWIVLNSDGCSGQTRAPGSWLGNWLKNESQHVE